MHGLYGIFDGVTNKDTELLQLPQLDPSESISVCYHWDTYLTEENKEGLTPVKHNIMNNLKIKDSVNPLIE